MENVRIAILSANQDVCAFMDNSLPDALHFYNDELHRYVKGSAATFGFSASAKHEDAQYLVEGNKLVFVYRDKDYYFNIVKVEKDEHTVDVTAYSLSFELLNDTLEEYKASQAMSFERYLDIFDSGNVISIGINEVSKLNYKGDFSGETLLKRMYSLAEHFNAEVEFVPVLADNYTLKKLIMNIYREHDDRHQGMGKDRTDIVMRYGKNVKGVRKTSDITGLYTAIRPKGNDGISIMDVELSVKDENGEIEYTTKKDSPDIFAVQARQRFPSALAHNNGYIYVHKTYNTSDKQTLWFDALHDLQENCAPKSTYEIDGFFDTDIGDTVSVEDSGYNPPLYLSARVTEQVVSFTDPSRNKSTFSNIKEFKSQISSDTIERMQAMIDANKVYNCSIVTDNGIVFKNCEGSTTLTASVMDGGKDITDEFTINWYKDGVAVSSEKNLTVAVSDITEKAVYRFEAITETGTLKGSCEVTVINVNDGTDGKDGADGAPGKDGTDGEDGAPGADGVSFRLIPSAPVIKKTASGTFNPASITATGYKYPSESTDSETMYVFTYYTTSQDLNNPVWTGQVVDRILSGGTSSVYSVPNSATAIKTELRSENSADALAIDAIVIPVVLDGTDGTNGADGADGADSTSYKMLVNAASIAKTASGTYKQTTITVQGRKQTGTGAFSSYACRLKIETTTSSNLSSATWTSRYTSGSNVSSYTYTIPSGVTGIRCSMYLAGGTTTLLDQVIIPIVADGTNGTVLEYSSGSGTRNTTYVSSSYLENIYYKYGRVCHYRFVCMAAADIPTSAVTLISGLPPAAGMQYAQIGGIMTDGSLGRVNLAIDENGNLKNWYGDGTIKSGTIIKGSITYITAE